MQLRIPILILCAALVVPRPALAWGVTGHAVVADIAESRLTPQAEAEVKRLLAVEGARHLSDISSWADEAKREGLPGSPSHTIRLPLDGSPAASHPCPGGFCADDALTQYEAVLADPRKPDAEREVALKYVVHLVGDLQQPLHDVDATGSGIKVEFDGKSSTLHKVWDNGIIDAHGGSAETIARQLEPLAARFTSEESPREWAEEGRKIAQTDIYRDIPPNTQDKVKLSRSYSEQQWPTVAQRLAEGGAELSLILNRLLTP